MRERDGIVFMVVASLMVILQSVMFIRFQPFGLIPDLLLVTVAVAGLRLTGTPLLVGSFMAGLLLDTLSADALGLRAVVYATVAYAVMITRERADLSPLAVAVWVGFLTVIVVVCFSTIGTLFGQLELSLLEVFRRSLVQPFLNMAICIAAWPIIVRVQGPSRRLI